MGKTHQTRPRLPLIRQWLFLLVGCYIFAMIRMMPLVSEDPSESKISSNCPRGARILLLEVHMEGNLGDELETFPLLQDWHQCNLHVTAVLSDWRTVPEHQFAQSSVRGHGLVQQWDSLGNNVERFLPVSQYDSIVLAPGPWRLCSIHKIWPYRIDILLGGSIIEEKDCPVDKLSKVWDQWQTSLIVAREDYSINLLRGSTYSGEISLTRDLSYSFEPATAALDYWTRVYKRRYGDKRKAIVFVRSNNMDQSVLSQLQQVRMGQKVPEVKLNTILGQSKRLSLSQVVFATSSGMEDRTWIEKLS